MMAWLIALLFGIAFAGLGIVLGRAIQSGAQVYAGTYSEDTARAFEDVFLFIPPRQIMQMGWACAAIAFTLVFLAIGGLGSLQGLAMGLAMGTIAGVLALRLPRQFLELLRQRRLKRFDLQLADTLVSMSNSLKAGFSIMQSFEAIVRNGDKPISQEFEVMLQETRVGVAFAEALEGMQRRVSSRDLVLVVQAIEAARRSGGNVTEILDKIAATIRERQRIEGRIRSLTAQGRLQGIVVGAMPILIGIVLALLDPGMMLPFLRSALGMAVVLAVVVLVSLGGLMIRKIVNIDV